MSSTNVIIVGAGQLGSRHLQALKSISQPLSISVIDPFAASLSTAKERYESLPGGEAHQITYRASLDQAAKDYDVAIIATNADVRAAVVEQLLSTASVRYIIFEKLLFQKKEDYTKIEDLLKRTETKAWVNCSMRTMPFYQQLKNHFNKSIVQYIVTGSQFGLVTNTIHYLDHLAYLTDCYDFNVITNNLDSQPIPSKRKGFLELNGTLTIQMTNGSQAILSCYPTGDAPILIEISSSQYRCRSRETERKAWVSDAREGWMWKEIDTDIPFQSAMTTQVVDGLLTDGTCSLTSYDQSAQLHINLLDSLVAFLSQHGQRYTLYPFT